MSSLILNSKFLNHLFWKFKTLTDTAKEPKKRMLKQISTMTDSNTDDIPLMVWSYPRVTEIYSLTVPWNPGP